MNFLDIFRARKTDPQTSKDAAVEIQQAAKQHFAKIHDVLIQFGPLGKDGIAYFALMDGNQIARRLPEMKRLGMVDLTGKTVTSNSGRKEREWMAL
jgi:hypothetical protein